MTKEEEQKAMEEFALFDTYVSLASAIEQYGTRKVLSDFKEFYPAFFKEIAIQIPRVETRAKAALLRAPDANPV